MDIFIGQIAQFLAISGVLLWMAKRTTDRMDALLQDMAIIKNIHENCTSREDHSKILILESLCVKCKHNPRRGKHDKAIRRDNGDTNLS
jgi:hypothetical protein